MELQRQNKPNSGQLNLIKLIWLTHFDRPESGLQLCFWVGSDRLKRWTAKSRKLTPAMRAIYWQLGNAGRFTANRLTGSSWTQKIVDGASPELSNDTQPDRFSSKIDRIIFNLRYARYIQQRPVLPAITFSWQVNQGGHCWPFKVDYRHMTLNSNSNWKVESIKFKFLKKWPQDGSAIDRMSTSAPAVADCWHW
jgi:hypothetical protein